MATNSDPSKRTRTATRRDSTGAKEEVSVRELLVQMNRRFDTLATKEDLGEIKGQIQKNADDIEQVRNEMQTNAAEIRSEMKANSESIPETVQSEIYKVLRNRNTGGAANEDIRQHQNYLLCRRNIRMWPVTDTGGGLKAAVQVFMEEVLEVEGQAVNRLGIENVSPTQQLPRSKIKDEVLVNFFNSEDRDLVYAHARNLAKQQGKAGIRLEIPQHLRPEFKLLEGHGNNIRNLYGPAVKRSIRFDDSECSLVLNMKLSADDPWVSVSVEQARETKKMRTQASISMIRSSNGNMQQPLTTTQGRALGLPNAVGPRPRPLTGPSSTPTAAPSGGTPQQNPFSYLNNVNQSQNQ